MRIPPTPGSLALVVACVLPLAACDVVGSATGDAAKKLLDRAAAEMATDEEGAGERSEVASETAPASAAGASNSGGSSNVYYQYVDDSGSVRFVQDRAQIPAKYRAAAGKIELESRPATRSAAAPRAPRRDIWKTAAEAPWSGGQNEVVMYTAPWCGVCRRAEAYFDRNGVDYTAKDIEASDAYKRELVQKTGRSAVPVIEIGRERLVGWDQRRVAKLLAD